MSRLGVYPADGPAPAYQGFPSYFSYSTAMSPLAQAIQVSFQTQTDDGTFCYRCELEPTWAVGALSHGGYSLGVIIEACIQHQFVACSHHLDPIHLSANFLRPTNLGIGQVRVKLLKSGKTFTNILAELVQKGSTTITAHILFGDLTPSQSGQDQRPLLPPSTYARRVPLYAHPSSVLPDLVKQLWIRNFATRVAVDTALLSRNDPSSPTRTTSESVGGGGVEWGAWCQLTHKDDKLTTSCIPHFCDTYVALPVLLPESEPASVHEKSRPITVAMTIEFKARVPSCANYSARTVGLYCESRFQGAPGVRVNERVEVWTAPCEIGQGVVTGGWRDQQYCIAVADQVTMILPTDFHQGRAKDSAKL